MHSRLIIAAILLLCFSFSCSHGPGGLVEPGPAVDVNRSLTPAERHLADADNTFGFNLFQAVDATETAADPDRNVFISPLSVSLAFGMALNGARGTTKDAIETALGFNGLTTEQINGAYRTLTELLTNLDRDVTIDIAQSIWYRTGLPVSPGFIDVNRTYFDAEVAELDFSAPNASQTINNWVNTQTNGKIEKIVPDAIPWDVVMYLINAIYFKGTWEYQFDPDDTYDGMFTMRSGTQKTVRMMSREGDFGILHTNLFSAAELTYGNGLYSMIIILPESTAKLGEVIAALNSGDWEDWMESFHDAGDMQIMFPKFTLEYEIALNKILKSMGMQVAFDDVNADFSGMVADPNLPLFISEVKHKTFVEVNEEGTEAAAVTSIGISFTSVPAMFSVNRPFIVAIRDRKADTILFIGKIMNPEYE